MKIFTLILSFLLVQTVLIPEDARPLGVVIVDGQPQMAFLATDGAPLAPRTVYCIPGGTVLRKGASLAANYDLVGLVNQPQTSLVHTYWLARYNGEDELPQR